MKRLLMLIPLVLLCCLGCQQGERVLVEPKADVEADIQAIKDIVSVWNDAVNNVDIDRIISLYADDAVEIHPDDLVLNGKEVIREAWQQIFDQEVMKEVFITEDVKVGCDLAVAHITYSNITTLKSGGEPTRAIGNWIAVFKRQPDVEWKCIYSIFSSDGYAAKTVQTE